MELKVGVRERVEGASQHVLLLVELASTRTLGFPATRPGQATTTPRPVPGPELATP